MKIVFERTRYHQYAFYFDYTPDRIEFCKALKDAFGFQRFGFDSSNGLKRWVFSEPIFVQLLKERFPNVVIDKAVETQCAAELKWMSEDEKRQQKLSDIEKKTDTTFNVKGLKMDMYPYQKVGVEFLTESGGRALIADAMGLGKTIQAIAFCKHKEFKRVLVVCPASVKFSWENEVKKWTRLTSKIIDSKTKLHEIPADTIFWIINYDILKKFKDELLKTRFDAIVGDEAHMIKNPQAIRTKVFRMVAKEIPNVVLLTGTPLLSRPVELFSLLNIIDPKNWSSYYEYVKRYCGAYQDRFGLNVSGASNIEELHTRIKKYFLRREKTEVLKELPPKNRIDVPVQLAPDALKEYEIAEKDLAVYLRHYAGKQPAAIAKTLGAEKLARLNVLRMLNALGKVPMALELIESIIESGEKVLVFSSFVDPLNQMALKFKDKAVMITGQTPVEDRGNIVKKFQEDPNVQVFLGGIKSAGVGITLTAASNVLFLDYSWNPADHQQAEDRAHRPGQEAALLNIYTLFSKGTIDEDLRDMLAEKQDIFNRVIDGKLADKFSKSAVEKALDSVLTKYEEEE